MPASRPYRGDSNSAHYMEPEERAEALCDELQSGARAKPIDVCICKEAVEMLRAALAFPDHSPTQDPKK